MHSLIHAVFKEDPPPCERGCICRHYDRCKTQELACESFYGYVVGAGGKRGRPLSKDNPSHELFVKAMMASGDKKEKIKAKQECLSDEITTIFNKALRALAL